MLDIGDYNFRYAVYCCIPLSINAKFNTMTGGTVRYLVVVVLTLMPLILNTQELTSLYETDALPQDSTPAWTPFFASGTVSVANGYMTLATPIQNGVLHRCFGHEDRTTVKYG